jgi:hypothetical protein
MKNSEYIVDRLRADINRLEKELLYEKSHNTDVIIAEIMLAIGCFVVGCIVGAVYL